ncbi:DivIVA domain-containing protein [Jatrophihabitans sp.]|jgi:hypothetical protein|uniref:DivIVA domain-containing protein n=1 Tax=Jatrophihabitans sp. TaxID=1932789 RepID=UPI002F0002F4
MLLLGYLLLALVVAALLFYGMVALLPGGLSLSPQRDNRPFELPADRRMVRADLDRVRIPVGVRGYRFAETDDLIDRLAAEIVVRDEEIARLRSQAGDALERPTAPDRPTDADRPTLPDRPVVQDRAVEQDRAARQDRPERQDQPGGRQVQPPGESPAAAGSAEES